MLKNENESNFVVQIASGARCSTQK